MDAAGRSSIVTVIGTVTSGALRVMVAFGSTKTTATIIVDLAHAAALPNLVDLLSLGELAM